MSIPSDRARVWPALLCACLLAACDDAPEEQAASTSTVPKAGSTLAGLPPQMVAAVSAGKSAKMVGVHFALGGLPIINKPLPVDIAIVPHVPFTSIRVYFEARDGVALGVDESMGPLTDALPEKPILHKIMVQPLREGVYTITASVDTEGTEGSITRVFSIPIIVGPAVGPGVAAGETPTATTPTAP